MKNKKKHLSKSAMSILLALVLLVSTAAVGIIATSAAYSDGILPSDNAADVTNKIAAKSKDGSEELGAKDDSDSVGWTTGDCKVHYKIGSSGTWEDANIDSSGIMTITYSGSSSVTMLFDLVAENWWYKGKEGQYQINSVTTDDSANYYAWYDKSSDSGNKGDRDYQVTLPSAGTYKFRYVTRTNKGSQSDAELQFNFWKVNTSYTISYNDPTNGSFTTAPDSATSGSSVSFTATPSTGYTIDTVTVTSGSSTVSTTNSGNTYTFTMPSAAVSVNATFKKASYDITANATQCTVSGYTTPAEYGSLVSFIVTPETGYALKTLTVKSGNTTVNTTKIDDTRYSFTMPAGNVTITAVCASTSGEVEVYFKSATAWVYHPVISVNGGAEQEMTNTGTYLDKGSKSDAVKPKSDTGSLRYAWYRVSLTGVDTSKPVSIHIHGKDTYMEAEGTFNISSGSQVYLACDNLMEGKTLVDISSLSEADRDFYDTPLNMINN